MQILLLSCVGCPKFTTEIGHGTSYRVGVKPKAAELHRRLPGLRPVLSQIFAAHSSPHFLTESDEGALGQVQRTVLEG